MSHQPNVSDLKRFIEVFEGLSLFSAQQRLIRGYGAGVGGVAPVPEVVRTLKWLKELAEK